MSSRVIIVAQEEGLGDQRSLLGSSSNFPSCSSLLSSSSASSSSITISESLSELPPSPLPFSGLSQPQPQPPHPHPHDSDDHLCCLVPSLACDDKGKRRPTTPLVLVKAFGFLSLLNSFFLACSQVNHGKPVVWSSDVAFWSEAVWFWLSLLYVPIIFLVILLFFVVVVVVVVHCLLSVPFRFVFAFLRCVISILGDDDTANSYHLTDDVSSSSSSDTNYTLPSSSSFDRVVSIVPPGGLSLITEWDRLSFRIFLFFFFVVFFF
jgi:hypothetical protein